MKLLSICGIIPDDKDYIELKDEGTDYISLTLSSGNVNIYRLYLYKSQIEELIKNLTIIKEEIK